MSKLISNNEFDSLGEFFSDKLKGSSMQPSDKVWQQIEDALNEDKKRKRGFFWLFFSGLLFMGASISTYFLFFYQNTNNIKSADFKNASIVSENKITKKTTAKKENTQPLEIEKIVTETEKTNTIKIQLGAFKKQIDVSVFNKTGLEIKSETNEKGVTKYYAEVVENEVKQALQQIKEAGFSDAFIKRNILLAGNTNQVKNTTIENIQKDKGNFVAENISKSDKKINALSPSNPQAKEKNIHKIIESNNVSNILIYENNKSNVKNISEKSVIEEAIPNKNTVENSGSTETISTLSSIIKTDSIPKDTAVNIVAVAKKDSLVANQDSAKAPVKLDSLAKEPLGNRWSLLALGGTNFFLKNTQSSLFTTANETQPITYNASLKVEYKLLKKLSVSAGISYNYFIAKQDATLFYFNKNLNGDFIFYSSYGPMAVDKNTMLQGFSPLAPVTMFQAKYSYTSKISTLAIPIEAKFYYLNNKKINLYAALGGSGMFVLSQQTNLSVIKEHITNNVSFNQITTTKANALLMLGFGGDIKLYKKLYFTIDGGFRYGVINQSNTIGTKTYPTYFSVSGGFKIKF